MRWMDLIKMLATFVMGMLAYHFVLSRVRRRHAGLPPSALWMQRLLAWLPLGWFATLGALVELARVRFGEWPSPRRYVTTFPPVVDPSWPDPGAFPWLLVLLYAMTPLAALSWVLFVPLALHAWREHRTPRRASLVTYALLHAALWGYWFTDPGQLFHWAFSN